MVTGHFATALLPYELNRNRYGHSAPFWVFLLASQLLDFLMLGFVAAGLERLTPHSVLDLSFAGMRSDMFVSHDLIPVAGWSIVFGLIVLAFTRQMFAALSCAALVIFHELCDLVVGFKHGVLAEDHPKFGLSLYTQAPITGLLIEALLATTAVWLFVQRRSKVGRPVSRGTQQALYGLLAGGALASLPISYQSVSQLFGL